MAILVKRKSIGPRTRPGGLRTFVRGRRRRYRRPGLRFVGAEAENKREREPLLCHKYTRTERIFFFLFKSVQIRLIRAPIVIKYTIILFNSAQVSRVFVFYWNLRFSTNIVYRRLTVVRNPTGRQKVFVFGRLRRNDIFVFEKYRNRMKKNN